MKRFYTYFSALFVAAAAMIAFTSCDNSDIDDDGGDGNITENPEVVTPIVSSVVVDEAKITVSSVSIEVTYSDIVELNYSYYVAGDEDNAIYDSAEVDVESTSYTISLSDLEAYTEYEIEVYGVGAEEVESTKVSETFKTLVPENDYYSLSNFAISPSSVTVDLTLKDGCEGVVVYADNASWFNASMVTFSIEGGYATFITESATISLASNATASTLYNYIIVPIANIREEEGEWGGTITTADIIGSLEDYYTQEVTTGDYDADFVITNATADQVKIGTITADITQLTVEVDRTGYEDVVAAYCGAVKNSELGDMSVAEWAVSTKYFNTAYASVYFVTDWGDNFYTSTACIPNLADDTDYTVFVVPVTASGAFGTITTAQATTSSYNFTVNEDLKPTIEIVPGLQSATVNITFGDCVKVYYDDYSTSYDAAKATIYQNTANGSYCLTDDGSGSTTYTISWLTSGTEYSFYCMGVDADGVYGAICEYTFTTTGLSWDGSTTATVTQVSGSLDEYGFADVVFDIDLSDDTYKATYAVVDESYISYDDVRNWGKYILENPWSNQTITSDGKVTVSVYGSYYRLVVVTEDASGVYGMPVVVTVDWDALDPYVDPDATVE